MISQDIRALAPEQDPLRMGMGWKVEDLSKPQIMIESTFGDSHPGSAGLFELVNEAAAGVAEAGGKAAAISRPISAMVWPRATTASTILWPAVTPSAT